MVCLDKSQGTQQTGIFMATDMQPLFSAFPNHKTPAVSEGRDRRPMVQQQGPSRDFGSVLGRAEARQTMAKHDAPSVRSTAKPGTQARLSTHSKSEASNPQSERSRVSRSEEQTLTRSEGVREKSEEPSEEAAKKDDAPETKNKASDQGAPQEILVAAMMVPAALPEGHATAPSVVGANQTEGAIEEEGGATASDHETTSAAQTTAAIPAGETEGQTLTITSPAVTAEAGKELKAPGEKAQKENVPNEGADMPQTDGQVPAPGPQLTRSDEALLSVSIDPDKMKPLFAAMTLSKQDPKVVEQGPADQVDRSTVLNALSQGAPFGEGQEPSGAGQYLGKDSQGFSDSSGGEDRSAPNPASTIDASNRPGFIERMNGVNQPTPSASDSGSNRSETGPTTNVAHVSASERLSELRGAQQVSQSVTLDLDPLDMGPLRVRVMMSDQTVHAHIRTAHGELGQGLLQQGQSLESSLRTTGLEMGMLRVTVDQQQGRGDNGGMFQQQQQGRPWPAGAPHSAAAEEDRGVRREQGFESSERMSIFA